MRKRRAIRVMGLGFCSAIATNDAASAPISLPIWDEGRLDASLPHPRAVIPITAYRQAKAETGAGIITYLEGAN